VDQLACTGLERDVFYDPQLLSLFRHDLFPEERFERFLIHLIFRDELFINLSLVFLLGCSGEDMFISGKFCLVLVVILLINHLWGLKSVYE